MRSMTKSQGWGAILMTMWFSVPLTAWAQSEPKPPPLPAPPKTEAPSAAAGPSARRGPPDPAAGPERGYLGAVVDDREDRGRGVRIEQVIPGGPAEIARLRKGDLITGVGGIRVRQIADFAGVLDQVIPGNTLTFEVLRGETREKVDVVFGVRPGQQKPGPASADPRAPLDLRGPGSSAAPPLPQPPKSAPGLKAPGGAGDDRARLEMLERRLEQLERRIEQLERMVSKQLSQ